VKALRNWSSAFFTLKDFWYLVLDFRWSMKTVERYVDTLGTLSSFVMLHFLLMNFFARLTKYTCFWKKW
jgi:hypothetical protein